MMTFAGVSGFMQMFWTLTKTTPTILTYLGIYGIVSGAYGASLNPGAASFAPNTQQAGLYLGMCFFTTSWFWMIGSPIIAALIDRYPSYLPASLFGGCALFAAAGLVFIARWLRVKQVGTPWV